MIKTNTLAVYRCTDKNGRMTLAGNNGGLQEVYIDIESNTIVSEVKSFRKRNLYAVASFYYDPKNGNILITSYILNVLNVYFFNT